MIRANYHRYDLDELAMDCKAIICNLDGTRPDTLGDIGDAANRVIPAHGNVSYRIWVSPQSRKTIDTCPFLNKKATSNRWQCRIHDVKPSICRQYPVSRKHAIMTGCPGFKRSLQDKR